MTERLQDPPAPRRGRRDRPGLRDALLDAALVEFAAKGFDDASTRAIAERADAFQPQVNYHFASKEALWKAAVERLFAELDASLGARIPDGGIEELTGFLADTIGRLVAFAARRPELSRIMMHEATVAGERLAWMTETQVRPRFEALSALWRHLRAEGVAADIDEIHIHHLLVGAASLVYANAPEFRLLSGRDPTDADLVAAHARALVTILLPGRRSHVD